MFFAIAIAIIPLVVAGRTMIRIAQDELKSSANEQLLEHRAAADRGDQRPLRAHLAGAAAADQERDRQRRARRPGEGRAAHARHRQHRRHRSAADHDQGLADPAGGAQRGLRGASRGGIARAARGVARPARGRSRPIKTAARSTRRTSPTSPETDDWLATVVLPLDSLLAGQESTLSARIDLSRLREFIDEHPLTKQRGFIAIVDADGEEIFESGRADLDQFDDQVRGARLPRVRARA